MNTDLETQIRGFAEELSADLPPVDVATIVHGRATGQMISPVPKPWRTWPAWAIPVLAALLVVVLIGGAALLFASPEGTDVVGPTTVPAAPEDVEPVPPPTIVEGVEPERSSPTTLPTEPVEQSAPITGMTWQQVVPEDVEPVGAPTFATLISAGDRFHFVDTGNTVATSVEGINWTTKSIQGPIDMVSGWGLDYVAWRDTLVGYGCNGQWDGGSRPVERFPGCVSVIHADGTVTTQTFEADINAVGIGPVGMVAIVTNHYDENGLLYYSLDFFNSLTGRVWEDANAMDITNGALHVEWNDGQVNEYVLADHGYTDPASRAATAWFSPDGEQWIPAPDFPPLRDPEAEHNLTGLSSELIGTEDGFVAISHVVGGGPNGQDVEVLLHSSNGLEWRELGPLPGGGALSRWENGGIVVGEESVWYVSGAGIEETPLSLTEPGEALRTSTTGGVGMVIVDFWGETEDMNQVLYSPDGQTWTETNVLPEMIATFARDYDGRCGHCMVMEVAATDTAVLLHVAVGGDGGFASEFAWFLGTPITD